MTQQLFGGKSTSPPSEAELDEDHRLAERQLLAAFHVLHGVHPVGDQQAPSNRKDE